MVSALSSSPPPMGVPTTRIGLIWWLIRRHLSRSPLSFSQGRNGISYGQGNWNVLQSSLNSRPRQRVPSWSSRSRDVRAEKVAESMAGKSQRSCQKSPSQIIGRQRRQLGSFSVLLMLLKRRSEQRSKPFVRQGEQGTTNWRKGPDRTAVSAPIETYRRSYSWAQDSLPFHILACRLGSLSVGFPPQEMPFLDAGHSILMSLFKHDS